jgi:hypothetical protein
MKDRIHKIDDIFTRLVPKEEYSSSADVPHRIIPKPKQTTLSPEHSRLVELIADNNIPFTQLESPAWAGFIHILNKDFVIPPRDQLRSLIIDYAAQITQEGLNDLRGEICGLAVDGAFLHTWHTYAFILIHRSKLRMVYLNAVTDQTGVTISKSLHHVYQE